MGAVLGLCSAAQVLSSCCLKCVYFAFLFLAGLLLHLDGLLVVLLCVPIMQELHVHEDHVRRDAALEHHSSLHHIVTRFAGRAKKGIIVKALKQQNLKRFCAFGRFLFAIIKQATFPRLLP